MSSRNWLCFDIPRFVIANHHIDDGQKFSHTSDNGSLLKFVSSDELLIKSFDNWIAANGSQGGHVEFGTDLPSAGEDVTSPTLFTTVTIEGSYASEFRYLMPVKLAQFRAIGEERHGGHEADAGDALQELVFALPAVALRLFCDCIEP